MEKILLLSLMLMITVPDSTYTWNDYQYYKVYGENADIKKIENYFKYFNDSITFVNKKYKLFSMQTLPNACIIYDGTYLFKTKSHQKRYKIKLYIGDSIHVTLKDTYRSYIYYTDIKHMKIWSGWIGNNGYKRVD